MSILFALLMAPAHAELGKSEFESIQRASKHILKNFPKKEWAYVGIGRGPVPVMAYLQTEPGTLVRNLPMTAFNIIESKVEAHVRPVFKPSAKEATAFIMHFHSFFPGLSELEGRKKVLLIDFVQTGHTLASIEIYLKRYLLHTKESIELKALGITRDHNIIRLRNEFPLMAFFGLEASANALKAGTADHFYSMMLHKIYRRYSEHARFDVNALNATGERRSEYDAYVEEIRAAKQSKVHAGLTDDRNQAILRFFHEFWAKKEQRRIKTPQFNPEVLKARSIFAKLHKEGSEEEVVAALTDMAFAAADRVAPRPTTLISQEAKGAFSTVEGDCLAGTGLDTMVVAATPTTTTTTSTEEASASLVTDEESTQRLEEHKDRNEGENEDENNSDFTVPEEACLLCKRSKSKLDGAKLLKCGRCGKVSYCSKECQKSDWKTHKPNCGKKEQSADASLSTTESSVTSSSTTETGEVSNGPVNNSSQAYRPVPHRFNFGSLDDLARAFGS